MTLNGVIAIILRYFAESDHDTMVEDRPILPAEYRFPILAKTDPPCSAIASW